MAVHDVRLPGALASVAMLVGLGSAPMAGATEVLESLEIPGATCQLSIPTTNTGVRPKATDFRNESTTTSNFVICPVVSPTARGTSFNPFMAATITLHTLDGHAHGVTCTGVVGNGTSLFPNVYSAKTISVPADSNTSSVTSWQSEDFGQAAGNLIEASAWLTITCSLPPQVEIKYTGGLYNLEIGS
jgi:hypothetical protein